MTRRKTDSGGRAERHADADLLRPLSHGVRHDAVDANRGERERDKREHAHQHRNRARPRDRAADDVVERADLDGSFRLPRVHDPRHAGASSKRILRLSGRRSSGHEGRTLGCRKKMV